MPSPILPPQIHDHPGSITIMLSREVSEAIAANADFHFARITHPAATSPPEAIGRIILVCLRTDKATLDAASRVALGQARAVGITPPAKP